MLEVELTRAGNDIKSVAAQARCSVWLLRQCRIASCCDVTIRSDKYVSTRCRKLP